MFAIIQPATYRTGSATRLVVRGVSVRLADRAIIEWVICDENKKEFESGGQQLSGDDYHAWSNDDQYVYTWLAGQLNLEIITIEPGDFWMS